ncbi:M23 family metallopeptidase [Nocardia sp. NPDC005366]|uniref:M23 family metallopeptidase n=1 Tax=Nocardia sp. NPDC005366 TaxID=3156878 RepID=UPI0033A0B439
MNNRSTLAPGNRARSGHRYRDDNEPFAHPEQGGQALPSPSHRYAPAAGSVSAGAAVGYGAQHDSGAHAEFGGNAWASNTDWAQQNSWSEGAAWSDGGAWTPDADGSWNDADASWSPQTDDSWTPDSNASWAQNSEGAWTPDGNGGWTPGEGNWTPDADGSWTAESETPDAIASPTIIPARAGNRRGGAHRMPAPPAALKGRAAVVAVAAGAVVAAGQCAFASPEQPSSSTIDYEAAGQIHEIAAQSVSLADPTADPDSPQVLNVSTPANLGQFNEMLQKGQKYAEDMAAKEASKLRPLFTRFAAGTFTSGYGARWGVQHLGIDIAGPIGTPIYAVADGTVIESGPAAGFGMWVRLLHDDGTVTIYGHIDTSTVQQGERVMAGDQIATIGNRGFSTGPHCHFEVWLNGSDKVDPLPWLASRGISLGPERD